MFLESVEAEYKTRDLYEVLGVSKDSKSSVIKKAYHKLSLKVHPDRVKPEDVKEATKKFQILCKIHLILSDDARRAVYDDTGCVEDEEDVLTQDRNWSEYWRLLFKKVTVGDIVDFEKKYKGSEEEMESLKSAYLDFEGDMDKIMDEVMCAQLEDEPRFRGRIAQWIAEGSVPSYPAFTGETEKRKKKRRRKFEGEAKEAEELRDELGMGGGDDGDESLKALIQSRQNTREKEFGAFFDKLEEKYGGKKAKKSKIENGPAKEKRCAGEKKKGKQKAK